MGVRNVSQTQQLCNLCGGDHINGQCAFPEELQQDVNYMGAQFQFKQRAFNQGSSSQGWKNHPNVGQNQNNSSGPVGGFRQQQSSPLWQQARFRSLESQIGQLSKRIETTEKNQFRANTDVNPKDECKAILTSHKRKAEGEPIDFESNEKGDEEMMSPNEVNEKGSSEDEIELTDEEEDPEEDVIEPEEEEEVEFTEEEEKEEFVVQPQKMKHPSMVEDPGCLTISCVLNECDVGEAMIDSGASISMLPKHFLTNFRGLVLKPSRVIVMVADGSMAKPLGMVEDVIVRVEQLEFLVDFIVMDVENDEEIPVIFGRPSMATPKMLISVHDKRIMMRDEEYLLLYTGYEEEELGVIRRVGHKKPEREVASEDSTSGIAYTDSCNILQVPVHQKGRFIDPELKEDPFQPGIKVKYKKREWVLKELKEKGMVEIETSSSGHIKQVDKRKLRIRCTGDTNKKDNT
ncbi:uncharacterized protein LOC106766150 [Vigna radiata var. radiata]|uniref:Uncharacterized protein LOC106766150 n=1 Tax=Vigna radiata var. radiata TaxID=3916 RepID=A0A1S3UKC7_VIGRR|nr:uncharacterized protein LOC106766150 [Vigna radiata var. radiata]